MRTLVGERDERATRAAATAITEQLNHRASAINSLALQATATGDPEHTLADATTFLPDFEGGLAFFDSSGSLITATNAAELWEGRAVIERLAASNHAPDPRNQAQFTASFNDPSTGEEVMLVASTMPNGLLAVGAFSPTSLARRALAEIFSASDQTAAFLVDANGRLLYQLGALSGITPPLEQHPGVIDALRGESGTTYLSVAGDEHVIAFSPIAPVSWALVFEEPWKAVTDPLLRTTELAPLILVPVVIIAVIGLWFGVRQIVQPLQSLEEKATELAWGDFDAIEESVGGINEIQRLQTELIHMAQKVKAAQQNLRGYLGAVTAGQEEERRRLARELHDDTIQSLIALNQQGQLAQMALEGHPAIRQLNEMQGMTAQMIADLRRLTRDLRPSYLEDLGLVPSLEMLARDTSISLDLPVEFEMSGIDRRLEPEVELALYRMVQEALSNVAHHAHASAAEVSLGFEPDSIVLTISDDGCGFIVPESPAEMAPTGHYGLLGLHERAELIGGLLTIHSEPDQGTCVKVTIQGREPSSNRNKQSA
ncbi:MAG TPA: histidine kinase [candidate division Zixibacteria bacterium]|nr:histidine kinase [candidate division Zixibacteria bacterium]